MRGLADVRTVAIPSHVDARGALTAFEVGREVPFAIERIFYMHAIQPPFERGGHAHPDTQQFLVCVAGSVTIDLSDGEATRTFVLDSPTLGLYVPELIWAHLYRFTPDAVCLAAASTLYDNAKVIRDWSTYLDLVRVRAGRGTVR